MPVQSLKSAIGPTEVMMERQPAGPPAGGLPTPVLRPPATTPGSNPFESLPYPAPGDRIRSDDVHKLSQALRIIYDAHALSAALFGAPFGDARQRLGMLQYRVGRVLSVLGTELGPDDAVADARRVIQVLPAALGGRELNVVVSDEARAPQQQLMPNLVGLTYRQAIDRLRLTLGEVPPAGASATAPQLTGLSLAQVRAATQG